MKIVISALLFLCILVSPALAQSGAWLTLGANRGIIWEIDPVPFDYKSMTVGRARYTSTRVEKDGKRVYKAILFYEFDCASTSLRMVYGAVRDEQENLVLERKDPYEWLIAERGSYGGIAIKFWCAKLA